MDALLQIAMMIVGVGVVQGDDRHPSWLIGDWGDVATGERGEPDCGDHTLTYYPDGYFGIVDQTGTWTYRDGSVCTRVLIEGDGTDATYRPGQNECQLVRRTSRGIAQKWNGHWVKMMRCGDVVGLDKQTRNKVDRAERRRIAENRNGKRR